MIKTRKRTTRKKTSMKRTTRKRTSMKRTTRKRTYKKSDYNSEDGMLTSVWGPSMWHYLHTISFNYPVKPTQQDKKYYKSLIMNLKYTLPCGFCRKNLKKNLSVLPLTDNDLKSRDNFSRWIYRLHKLINKMLGKKSGLTFCNVRDRYENFRSRCTKDLREKRITIKQHIIKEKEKGCIEPLFGKKSKCIIKIVPQEKKCQTFQMDKKCIKTR
uniref:thiol oxidase n=1 Tax=viral metagenome TaxID=1070528 RepID=A0A6C0KDK7_9ZZZZ